MSHFQVLTTCADDPSLGTRLIIKVKGYQHRWLVGGYDIKTFVEVANMMVGGFFALW